MSTNAMLDGQIMGQGEAADKIKELLDKIKEQDE